MAERVKSGDQEEDFKEQTLTLNEVEAKSVLFPGAPNEDIVQNHLT